MIWKEIPGVETKWMRYEASVCGQIRSVSKKTGKITTLKQYFTTRYYNVKVNNRSRRVHQLVCMAHLQKPEEADETWTVDHTDANERFDNSSNNLRWASISTQNSNQRKYDRTMINACPVVGIHIVTGEIIKFESAQSAEELYGISNSGISRCINGHQHTYMNYVWSTPLILPDIPGEEWKTWNVSSNYSLLFSNKGRFAYAFKNGYIKKLWCEEKNNQRANDEDRYPSFYKNKKEYTFHRIMYELFIGPIPNGMVVHHKNSNKQCAYLENIELTTQSKNMKYAHDDGRYDGTQSARKPIEIDGIRYESQADAAKELRNSLGMIWYRVNSPHFPTYVKIT
jgi:hypothetical protein